MGKHFELVIKDGKFSYCCKEETIRRREELDRIYAVRTTEPKEKMSREDVVRGYKGPLNVERMYRSLKRMDILVCPISSHT